MSRLEGEEIIKMVIAGISRCITMQLQPKAVYLDNESYAKAMMFDKDALYIDLRGRYFGKDNKLPVTVCGIPLYIVSNSQQDHDEDYHVHVYGEAERPRQQVPGLRSRRASLI